MIGKVYSAALLGIDANIISVEADIIRAQLPQFSIVGLPDKAIQEAKERITSAIRNSGFEWPRKKIVVNLAPAEVPKTGTSFDLPIALALLISSSQIEPSKNKTLVLGELALDGRLRPVNGIISVALEAEKAGYRRVIIPDENLAEAGLVKNIVIIGVSSLKEACQYFSSKEIDKPTVSTSWESLQSLGNTNDIIDFAHIKGQSSVKRAAEIAASGGHNLLFTGSPGSGKTLLSKAIASILPKLTFEESVEITKIYSVANLLDRRGQVITTRPFRAPHHTASTASIVGGGRIPHPGELSLAHRGVLFLDEFPEFSSGTLEALRQPLEDRIVVVSRAAGTLVFPANFMLVAAMNPCKCGWKGDKERECICTAAQEEHYKRKISGPILDRLDLQINVPRVDVEDLSFSQNENSENSQQVQRRVQESREIQLGRFKGSNIWSNAEIPQKFLAQYCPMETAATLLLKKAAKQFMLSARSYYRLVRVARTIADLGHSEVIQKEHILEAIQYRMLE